MALLTEEDVRRMSDNGARGPVVVNRGEVLTPGARDWLRAHRVEVVYPQGGGHRQLRRGAPASAGQKAGPAEREHEKTKAGSPRDSGGAGTAKTDD